MKITNTIAAVREEKVNKDVNGLIAFICLFQYSTKKAFYGINYLSANTVNGLSYLGNDNFTKVTVIEKF